jgi:hypothetical protein
MIVTVGADPGKLCGARLPRLASRRCVLPAGHAGSHRYALLSAQPGPRALATRPRAWWRTKTCPECGERVMVLARVCSVCGNRFDRPVAPRRVEPRTSQAAVVAMACSLIGIWIVSIPLGIHARRAVAGSGGRLTGRGLGTIAVAFGVVDMIATAVLLAVLV